MRIRVETIWHEGDGVYCYLAHQTSPAEVGPKIAAIYERF